jgi:hypothetical protein
MRMKLLVVLIIITILSSSIVVASNNQIKSQESFDGYILFAPEYSKRTFLMDNSKKIVHTWKSDHIQALGHYLLENGSLLRTCAAGLDLGWTVGGYGGRVEMFDWDGALIWEFEYISETHCLHNDIEPLPNGNILMIGWERKTPEEATASGCDPDLIPDEGFRIDQIIEVEPTFPSGGNIVWEWHVWDHIIQDYNSSKDNYGIVKDHPELIDINFRGLERLFSKIGTDFIHINGVDYNEELDQIVLTARNINEIWIIDHSTTVEEASGHTGGRYGKGGDILYRWGNPQIYDSGDVDDQKLFVPHDAKWIETGCPGEGHITIFNNGDGRPGVEYSSIEEIVTPVDEEGDYYLEPGSAYGPEESVWIYAHEHPILFYSSYVSGAQRLPNGNTFICSGFKGIFIEVTPEKEIVWRYFNFRPVPVPFLNQVFKTQCYQKDYPGILE